MWTRSTTTLPAAYEAKDSSSLQTNVSAKRSKKDFVHWHGAVMGIYLPSRFYENAIYRAHAIIAGLADIIAPIHPMPKTQCAKINATLLRSANEGGAYQLQKLPETYINISNAEVRQQITLNRICVKLNSFLDGEDETEYFSKGAVQLLVFVGEDGHAVFPQVREVAESRAKAVDMEKGACGFLGTYDGDKPSKREVHVMRVVQTLLNALFKEPEQDIRACWLTCIAGAPDFIQFRTKYERDEADLKHPGLGGAEHVQLDYETDGE